MSNLLKPYGCRFCNKRFKQKAAVSDHLAVAHLCCCPNCQKNPFQLLGSRQKSLQAKRNACCVHCSRSLATPSTVQRHALNSCIVCNKLFRTEAACEAHQKSTGHAFCKLCNRHFDNDTQLRRHEKDSHAVHFHCCLCDKDFVNNTALVQHLADKIHPVSEAGYRCEACDRTFKNRSSLKQHQLSPLHRPLANLTCLARSCSARFNCPSALIHHLESGRCSSGWSRQSINSVLHQYDTNRVITRETVSLETSVAHPLEDSSSTSTGSAILTPSDSSMLDGDEWIAVAHPNDRAGKLRATQAEPQTPLHCFLCAEKGIMRGFKSLKALQDHMSSPAHESQSFKCPLAFTVNGREESAGHSRTFTTLSGLTQHLESARCRGGKPTLWKFLDYLKTEILRVEWPGRLVRD